MHNIGLGSEVQDTYAGSRPPFLTVITRTQGKRPVTLGDVLVALAAQSCDDFELLIVGHCLDMESLAIVQQLIDGAPVSLRRRTTLLSVDRGNRTAPLNEGFSVARGEYISILDDDDVPMAHWVETFKDLAHRNPKNVLRAVAIKQQFDEVHSPHSSFVAPRAITGFDKEYPSHFEFLDHLRINQTPPIALAFPRIAFVELDIKFDESLTTTEDWDFLMRTVNACGIASTSEITAIYRWWTHAESSRSVHPQEEWKKNHAHILKKMDLAPLHLPVGSARKLRDLLDRVDRLTALTLEMNSRLARHGQAIDLQEFQDVDTDARAELLALLQSRSWRISAPLRLARRLLRGLPPNVIDVGAMSTSQVNEAIRSIRASSSWRITAVMRKWKTGNGRSSG